MEDHKIKSAREIAMEKVAKMSGLTPEELKKQEEREYKPRGEAIAKKYLESAIREADLRLELGKYQGEEWQIVTRSLISTLCQSIQLGDVEKSERAIEGMRIILKANGRFEKAKAELKVISVEFEQQAQQRYLMLETLEREKLRGLGISGSAVRPNLWERGDWQREVGQIQQVYDGRVNKLKEELARYAESCMIQTAK